MTSTELYVNSKPVRLGSRVGKGGEGEVFALSDDSSLAIKIYTTADVASRERKIAAMVRAELAKQTPLVAFPITIARRRDGSFAGFLMRLVSGHKPLHDLYSPGSRKQHFPHADYRFLARVATNIARAVAAVHHSGCVIGDINHSSMLVSQKAVVALIDADSFQVTDGAQRYLCRVGVPEYTPPELQGKPLATVVRTPNHDAFGLAVVLFQVLFMGRHPFVGTVRRGEIPPLHQAIHQYRYVYAENRDVGMDQPPGTPAISEFSPDIAAAFDAAFSKGSTDQRPTAAAWVKLLEGLEASLSKCQDNPLHYGPRDASDCAWCEMERALGTILFLPFVPRVEITVGAFDPGAHGFNLEAIWTRIDAVKFPARESLRPRITVSVNSPSAQAAAVKTGEAGNKWQRVGSVIVALLILFSLPQLWFVWLPLGLWGVFATDRKPSINKESFTRRYLEAETSRARELESWYQRCGVNDFASLRNDLQQARDLYKALPDEERNLIEKYRTERKARQLHSFLNTFDIQHATIKGVGPAKRAALASYGIDTAADVSLNSLLGVPGFGTTNSKGLLEWRERLERRFVYRVEENDADRREIARIRSGVDARAAELRRKLLAGPQNLDALAKRAIKLCSIEDPAVVRAEAQRDQARVDLEFLGIPVPSVSASTATRQSQPTPVATPTGTAPSTYRPTSTPPTRSTGTPSCPRCGSQMIRRLARRGRNAGGYFWGCSRYPRCKGTRSI